MEIKPSHHCSQVMRLEQDSKAAENAPSGCVVLEYSFHNLVRVELSEVRFTNFYVAQLSMKARFKSCAAAETRVMRGAGTGGAHKWRTVLLRRQLMPNPHLLTGSQDSVILREKDFRLPLKDIAAVRFILQQPSPMWKEFHLDEISFWRTHETHNEATMTALYQLASLVPPGGDSARGASTDGDDDSISQSSKLTSSRHPHAEAASTKLLQLWAMSAHCQAARPVARVGDYEKDGCYEGSLLAYS